MEKEKILVIDDEAQVCRYLNTLLRIDGFDVLTAENGRQGLDLFRQYQPQVVILDLRMPVMDGIQFLKEVRPRPESDFAVIVLTGCDGAAEREKGYELGVQFYLNKPIKNEDLRAIVKQCVDLKRVQRQLARQPIPPLRVLLVDPDPEFREAMLPAICQGGRQARSAASAGEALALLKDAPSDLLVTALELPGIGGLRLMEQVRLFHPYLLVLALTGGGNVADAVACLRAGAVDYLQKPVTPESLVLAIETAADRWRLRHLLMTANEDLVRAHAELKHEVAERKRIEQHLRESEARYRAIVEDQTDFIVRFSTDGGILFANDAFCRYVQKPAAELKGLSLLDFFPTEESARLRVHLGELGPDRPTMDMEMLLPAAEGNQRWTTWTHRALFSAGDHPAYFQSVGRDITEQHVVESALRYSEQWQRLLLEQLPVVLWTTNLDLYVTSTAGAHRHDLPIAHGQLVGQSVAEVIDVPEVRQQLLEAHREALAGANACVEGGWGGQFYHVNVEPLRDEGGLVMGCIGVAHDISSYKHALAALRGVEQEKDAILAGVSEIIIYFDSDLRARWANQAFFDLYPQLTPELLGGRYCHDIWLDLFGACSQCPARQVLQQGVKLAADKQSFDGRSWRVVISPVMTSDGGVAGVITSLLDIAGRKPAGLPAPG